ncbi:hypothetical protein UK15_37650 [Streptomyces variegatus]|uniref:Uncharacterized protein n=1 Tax=Streptomyces variegatus TaxID=284040 RepID=A0A0M2GFI8_9ACTN|nr:hypothetical protein UK15_37650 [Streptomyces variegatus]
MSAQRHHDLTEQAADTAIDQACRMLRLPTFRGQFSDLAEAAKRDQMSYKGFLAELLLAECDDRARSRSERRIKAAAFPDSQSWWRHTRTSSLPFLTLPRGPGSRACFRSRS